MLQWYISLPEEILKSRVKSGKIPKKSRNLREIPKSSRKPLNLFEIEISTRPAAKGVKRGVFNTAHAH